jgi:DHA2 family multidrug resistance protein
MFLTAPIVGRLMLKVDMRLIIVAGLIIFAAGSYQMTWMTRDYDFYELLVPQILRGIGMMFAMVPTNNIALGTLPPDRVKNASGLFNLTRNLGGALGLAVINEVLNDRTDLHISRLQDRVTWGNATATETLNMLTQRMQGLGDASMMALKQLSQIVHRQAVVMGYSDAFLMLTVFYCSLSFLVLLLKKPALLSSGPAH